MDLRADFTIETTLGVLYDANMITVGQRSDGKPTISFQCSGEMMTMPAEDVKTVRYNGVRKSGCPFCHHHD